MKRNNTLKNFILILIAFCILAFYFYSKIQSKRTQTANKPAQESEKQTDPNTYDQGAQVRSPISSDKSPQANSPQPTSKNEGLPLPVKHN